MKRKFLFLAGTTLAAAVVLTLTLGGFGRSSKVSADPVSFDFDIILCDGVGGNNDPTCTDPLTAANNGAVLGDIEPGDNPEVKTNLTMDTSPATADEAFFALANTVWQGVTPTPGYGPDGIPNTADDIVDGDEVGEIFFSIESNLIAPLTSNVSGLTGQPPKCATGIGTLTDTFKLYDSELDDTQTVPHTDTDGDGDRETEEDNFLADCSTAGSNGLADGIDCVPQALAQYTIPNLGLGDPIARSFGIALVAPALGVTSDVNFLIFEFDLDGDSTNDGYLSVTLVGYTGMPGEAPSGPGLTAQTVITCPPFISNVRNYGIAQGNAAAVPPIASGTVNRTAGADGTYPYRIDLAKTDNYDGDPAAEPWESCPDTPSADADLCLAEPDPVNADRWDTACDPEDGTSPPPVDCDNDADGTCGPYNLPVVGTWPMSPGNCNTVYDPPLPGGWDCDQDVDGDGTLNTVDNCALIADADVDGDTIVDWQVDSDSDTVGDVCDPDASMSAKDVKGDGTGYLADAHPHGMPGQPAGYHSHNDRCTDAFTIPAAEVAGGRVCESQDLGRAWVDSDNDGDPDWNDASGDTVYQIGEDIDTDDDSDADGHTDACEAVSATDPLEAASAPGAPADATASDCDGGGENDESEEKNGRDITNPADDVVDVELTGAELVDPETGDAISRLEMISSVYVPFKWRKTIIVTPPAWVADLGAFIPPMNTQWHCLAPGAPGAPGLWCTVDGVPVPQSTVVTVNGLCDVDVPPAGPSAGDFVAPYPCVLDWGSLEFVPGSITIIEEVWEVHVLTGGEFPITVEVSADPQNGTDPTANNSLSVPVVLGVEVCGDSLDNDNDTLIDEGCCELPFTDLGIGVDTDCDGATDAAELGSVPAQCGTRDPNDRWDFYDVPVATIHSGGDMNNRDSAVTLFNDVLGVLEYSGAIENGPPNGGGRDYDDDVDGDTIKDGVAYDREVGAPWPELGPGKSHTTGPTSPGAVTLFVDVLLVLDQSGHICP